MTGYAFRAHGNTTVFPQQAGSGPAAPFRSAPNAAGPNHPAHLSGAVPAAA